MSQRPRSCNRRAHQFGQEFEPVALMGNKATPIQNEPQVKADTWTRHQPSHSCQT